MKARVAASRKLTGAVGPSNPGPLPPPPRRTVPAGALATVSPEMRAMLALGYPLWPLAALSLLGFAEFVRDAVRADGDGDDDGGPA